MLDSSMNSDNYWSLTIYVETSALVSVSGHGRRHDQGGSFAGIWWLHKLMDP